MKNIWRQRCHWLRKPLTQSKCNWENTHCAAVQLPWDEEKKHSFDFLEENLVYFQESVWTMEPIFICLTPNGNRQKFFGKTAQKPYSTYIPCSFKQYSDTHNYSRGTMPLKSVTFVNCRETLHHILHAVSSFPPFKQYSNIDLKAGALYITLPHKSSANPNFLLFHSS